MSQNNKIRFDDPDGFKALGLAPDEEALLRDALSETDQNVDGAVDVFEFEDWKISLAAEGIFTGLYNDEISSALTRKIFFDLEILLSSTKEPTSARLEKKLHALDEMRDELAAKEPRQTENVFVTNDIFAASRPHFEAFARARENFNAALDAAEAMLENGDWSALDFQIQDGLQNYEKAKISWDKYQSETRTDLDAWQDLSEDMAVGAATTEAVLVTGGLAAAAESGAAALKWAAWSSLVAHAGPYTLYTDHVQDASLRGLQERPPTLPKEFPLTADAEVLASAEEAAPANEAERLHTETELIGIATQIFIGFLQTGQVDADLGQFIVEANLAEDYAGRARYFPKIWEEFQARRTANFTAAAERFGFTAFGTFENAIEELRKSLYVDGTYAAYWRSHTLLADGLDLDQMLAEYGLGGNCDFRTQVLVSYMLDPRFPKHPDWEPGVQLEPGHIQPVLYNAKTRQVWDLQSDEITDGVANPVYQPALLFWAYVAKRNFIPAVPHEALLIATPDGTAAPHSNDFALPDFPLGTDSLFAYPPQLPSITDLAKDIPEFAFETFSSSGERDLGSSSGGSSYGTATSPAGLSVGLAISFWQWLTKDRRPIELASLEDYWQHVEDGEKLKADVNAAISDNAKYEKLTKSYKAFVRELTSFRANTQAFGFVETDNQRLLIFATATQATIYAGLGDAKEKLDYLNFLTDQKIRDTLKDPATADLLKILAVPEFVVTIPDENLSKARVLWDKIIAIEGNSGYPYQEASQKLTGSIVNGLKLSEYPAGLEIQSRLDDLKARFTADPGGFLVFVNSLPETRRKIYWGLVGSSFMNSKRYEDLIPLLEFASDPAQVRFSQNEQTPLSVRPFGYVAVPLPQGVESDAVPIQILAETEIHNLDDTTKNRVTTPFYDGANSSADFSEKQNALESASKAPVVLSPEMLLLLIEWQSDVFTDTKYKPPSDRWTPEISEYFLKQPSYIEVRCAREIVKSRLLAKKAAGQPGIPAKYDIAGWHPESTPENPRIVLTIYYNRQHIPVVLPLDSDLAAIGSSIRYVESTELVKRNAFSD